MKKINIAIVVAALALCGCETITGTVTVPGVGSFTPAVRVIPNPVVIEQPTVLVAQPAYPVASYPAPPPYMPAEMPMRATMTVEK